jgi:hypothetical protein
MSVLNNPVRILLLILFALLLIASVALSRPHRMLSLLAASANHHDGSIEVDGRARTTSSTRRQPSTERPACLS